MSNRSLACAADELHESAQRRTKLSNFGDPGYLRGLRVLLEAFDQDFQCSAQGERVVREWISRSLMARLYTQHGLSSHGEVLQTSIRKPLVITGFPRTGTTALHRLLAVDPQFQGIEFWLARTPMPRPPRQTWENYAEYQACVSEIDQQNSRIPELRQAHECLADEVAECTTVLLQTFVTTAWSTLGLPSYDAWLRSQSPEETYRHYLNVLRLICTPEPHKRLLLKSPHHMTEIDALFHALPDACVIYTHRDPLKVIPSVCSLAYMYRRDMEGEAVQAATIGPWQCAHWRQVLDRSNSALLRWRKKLFHVDHRRFLADPLGTVRSIYETFELSLAPQTEEKMKRWIQASPTSRHGQHQYPAESWGVTSAQIREMFSDYRKEHQFT